ncbi:MAG TPA: hypothetical protein VJR04_10735 [Terriglobales bacterium]|nr:hypothetical protein [Terriglobales bacterium]
MANEREVSNTPQPGASQSNLNARQPDETHDPEFEIPDPEQVDRDIEQAERIFGQKKDAPKGDDRAA